ncbi:MAG TPA: hypothetical protein VFG07_09490 [Thermoplasmata archaeon]|nr:hypothetical protein [Thermoplasmata archaeon]
MKRIQVWQNHVAIPHLGLVIARDHNELLSKTLQGLQRLGFDTAPTEIDVHDGVRTE